MITLLRVARMSDRQILRLVDDLHELAGKSLDHCRVYIEGVALNYPSDELEEIRTAKKDIGAISAFDILWGQPTQAVRFRRGISDGGNRDSMDAKREPSPYFDEIGIDNIQKHVPALRLVEAKRVVLKHVGLPAETAVTGAAGEAIDLLKLQFAQLNEQLTEINTNSLKRRAELEDEFAAKREQAEEELRQRAEKLELDYRLRFEDLEARQKTLDDRDHIHARRELRTHITDMIAKQIEGDIIPRKASLISRGVLALLMVGAVVCGLLSGVSLYEFSELTHLASLSATTNEQAQEHAYAVAQIQSGFHWILLIRSFVSGAVALGFLLYAISWLKGLYNDEVRTRRELQRYATDLNRASWAIETIMEAKASGDVVIPDAVMVSVTKNLFEAPGSRKASEDTSANALADLLRTSAKARFGTQGAEFELTGRGANKLADRLDP